ncbi:MAG: hypothetical protein M1823_006397, partial [Watsoniomyces obsoletus]
LRWATHGTPSTRRRGDKKGRGKNSPGHKASSSARSAHTCAPARAGRTRTTDRCPGDSGTAGKRAEGGPAAGRRDAPAQEGEAAARSSHREHHQQDHHDKKGPLGRRRGGSGTTTQRREKNDQTTTRGEIAVALAVDDVVAAAGAAAAVVR